MIGLCEQHYNRILNQDNEYFLVHATSNMGKILESGGVLPISQIEEKNLYMDYGSDLFGKLSLEDQTKYNNIIFTSVIFPYRGKDSVKKRFTFRPTTPDGEPPYDYIVFPASVVSKFKNVHFTTGWNVGMFREDGSVKYNKDLTVQQNFNLFRHLHFVYRQFYTSQSFIDFFPAHMNGTTKNELIIDTTDDTHKSLNLKDSIFIYRDMEDYVPEYAKDNIAKYPEYNWVHENPFEKL